MLEVRAIKLVIVINEVVLRDVDACLVSRKLTRDMLSGTARCHQLIPTIDTRFFLNHFKNEDEDDVVRGIIRSVIVCVLKGEDYDLDNAFAQN